MTMWAVMGTNWPAIIAGIIWLDCIKNTMANATMHGVRDKVVTRLLVFKKLHMVTSPSRGRTCPRGRQA